MNFKKINCYSDELEIEVGKPDATTKMRRDLFVALALVSLTYVHGQPSDEPEKHDVNTELDPISKCLSEVKKEPKNFIDECHKLQKFKG